MSQFRNQALKISVYFDQLLDQIQEVRYGMYDMAEIPHLFNSNNLSIDEDLKIIGEAQQYINDNVSVKLSEELSLSVDENMKKLLGFKEQVESMVQSLEGIFSKLKKEGFEQKLQDKIYSQLLIISNVLSI